MRKLLTLFTALLFVGSMWAADYTLSFPQLDNTVSNYNSYTAAHSTESGGVTWSVFGNQSLAGDILRVGGKNTTNTDRTLTSGQIGIAVTKLTINHQGIGNGTNTTITINSIKLEVANNNSFTNADVITKSSPSVSSSGALEYTPTTGGYWAANSYYRITVNYKVTTTKTANNSYITFKTVVLKEKQDPTVTLEPTSLAWGDQKQNVAVSPATKTFTLTGANLTAGLTLEASTGYNVSPTSLTKAAAEAGATITVTPDTPTGTGANDGTITISGDDFAEDRVLNITMNVLETFHVTMAKAAVDKESQAVADLSDFSATVNGVTSLYALETDEFQLVATPKTGFEFVNWTTDEDNAVITSATSSTTTVNTFIGDVTITANFKESKNPAIDLDKTEINFDKVKGDAAPTATFTITAANISAAAITIVADDDIEDHITLSDASVDVVDGAVNAEITVTGKTDEAGEWLGNITVDDGASGATAKTIAVYITIKDKYTITWHVCGQDDQTTYVVEGNKINPIEDPTLGEEYEEKTFMGWAEAPIASAAASATLVDFDNFAAPTADDEFWAVFASVKTPASDSWDLCSAANNVVAGEYVITWDNSSYLPSEEAASNPERGTGITVANNKLTNTVTNDMKWTFTGDNTNGFAVTRTSGDDTYRLKSTNAAQGISVTKNDNTNTTTWKASVDNTYGMLLKGNDNGTRYLALYTPNSGTPTWRYYVVGDNYKGTLRLYKSNHVDAEYEKYETTVDKVPTALEDVDSSVKAVKLMRNGILLIEKNGRTYNAMGQVVK